MKIDLYAKSVLTVIAFALVGLLIQGSVRHSFAAVEQVMRVTVCNPDGRTCAAVGTMDGPALRIYGHTY